MAVPYRNSPLRVVLDRVTPTDHAIYMGADDGPFRCDACRWYGPAERCSEPHIIEAGRRHLYGLTLEGDLAVVAAGGCSDYFESQKGARGAGHE